VQRFDLGVVVLGYLLTTDRHTHVRRPRHHVMITVAGHLLVDPAQRAAYLAGCRDVVGAARNTAGCLDCCLSPDVIGPARINLLERWDSQQAVDAFQGSGPCSDQQMAIHGAAVVEYDIVNRRTLR
jgi:quinol monooxygenase YgiN